MTNTDGGKKVTAAMASTGRAVGGAVSQAKGVFSSWWGGGKKAGKDVSPGEEVKENEAKEIKPEEAAKVPDKECEAQKKLEKVETSKDDMKISGGDVKEEKLKEIDLREREKGNTEIG